MLPDHGIDAAELLKRARVEGGLSQRALAEKAGTAQSVVARIELGETSPTVGTLNRLLLAAGVQPIVRLHRASSGKEGNVRDLPDRIRRYFESSEKRGIVSVYLFGSAAQHRLHRESDVDVAVLLDRSRYPSQIERSELRIALSSDLVAATGRNEVDLVVLNDLPPLFARAIVLDGTRLSCAAPDLDHAFVRDTQLRAADLEPFLTRMRAVKIEGLRV